MDPTPSPFPKAFISYSHDSQDHKAWVLSLATRLRTNGVDAMLDFWDVKAGNDLPHYMETSLDVADYFLMICSNNYVSKANSGIGGVGYEKMIITSTLMDRIDQSKIIPIIRQNGSRAVPTFIKTKWYLDFSRDDNFEIVVEELLRTIHQVPFPEKPQVGNNPFLRIQALTTTPINDNLKRLMQQIGDTYEKSKGGQGFHTFDISNKLGIPLMAAVVILKDAVDKEFLIRFRTFVYDRGNDTFMLTPKGKQYILENNLI